MNPHFHLQLIFVKCIFFEPLFNKQMTFFQKSQQGKVVWDNHRQFARNNWQQSQNKVEREVVLDINQQFAREMK